ncbi:MAG: hypothetical protein M0Q90_02680 [Bacteroidales bacterium]|nr:hypothetical protein [Bacteroidales bacterium]
MEKQNKKLAQVLHFDLYEKREEKYNFLTKNSLKSIVWNELNPDEPNYYLMKKNFDGMTQYVEGFRLDKLFEINSPGIKTHRDNFVIDFKKETLLERIFDFFDSNTNDADIGRIFNLKDNRDWSISTARKNGSYTPSKVTFIGYRPFDNQYCYYDSNLIDFGRENVMQHLLKGDNIGLVFARQSTDEYWTGIQLSKFMIDNRFHFSYKGISQQAPLYLYSEINTQQTIDHSLKRTPNLNPEIVKEIAKNLSLGFVPEKEPEGNVCYINNPEVRDDYKITFAPIDLLDYIYAVLHSPTYREKYKEFLKIDFPRVPYPKDSRTFWQLVKLGGEIRQIHLLESPTVEKYITQYPIDGNNIVDKLKYKSGKVYINENQYFDNVPPIAWEFYIGGYQPAQKWLKDRKNRKLEFEDVQHYQKIIVALSETDRLMQAIDLIEIE